MLTSVIIFLGLLFLSGFFSSAELAMMSLTDLQVERMVKQRKRNAALLQRLKKDPHKLLETILIGNNIVNIGDVVFSAADFPAGATLVVRARLESQALPLSIYRLEVTLDDRTILDLRTIHPDDDDEVASALADLGG